MWLALYNLLIEPECRKKYQYDENRKETVLKVSYLVYCVGFANFDHIVASSLDGNIDRPNSNFVRFKEVIGQFGNHGSPSSQFQDYCMYYRAGTYLVRCYIGELMTRNLQVPEIRERLMKGQNWQEIANFQRQSIFGSDPKKDLER